MSVVTVVQDGGVRLLRKEDMVKVRYLDTHVEFHLNAYDPVHILPASANDDETSIEVCGSDMMAVRQIAEDGTVNTVCMSPRLAIALARLVDSFVTIPRTFE